MKFQSGISLPTRTVSSGTSDTIRAIDYTIYYTASMSSGVVLPSAASNPGRVFNIKNGHATLGFNITSSSGTIDGSATFVMPANAQYQTLTVQSDGTNWMII